MTDYYFPTIYIVLLISVDGQDSPRLFIAPEIRHEKKILYRNRMAATADKGRSYENRAQSNSMSN